MPPRARAFRPRGAAAGVAPVVSGGCRPAPAAVPLVAPGPPGRGGGAVTSCLSILYVSEGTGGGFGEDLPAGRSGKVGNVIPAAGPPGPCGPPRPSGPWGRSGRR